MSNKIEIKQKRLPQEKEFFIYVLEEYKRHKNLSGKEALAELQKTGADKFIVNCFGALHTMSTKAIMQDIDEFCTNAAN